MMRHAIITPAAAVPRRLPGLTLAETARIIRDVAADEMATHAPEAFMLGYVNPDWRAMRRRRFYAAREEYEAAKIILETLQC